jgi:hypothetical protein
MPLPPPAMPEVAVGAEDAGEAWAVGGSGRLSTRVAVTGPEWIEPVVSELGLSENGLSLKRDDSPLQAARAVAVRPKAAARNNGKRNHWTIRAIATHTDTQYEESS